MHTSAQLSIYIKQIGYSFLQIYKISCRPLNFRVPIWLLSIENVPFIQSNCPCAVDNRKNSRTEINHICIVFSFWTTLVRTPTLLVHSLNLGYCSLPWIRVLIFPLQYFGLISIVHSALFIFPERVRMYRASYLNHAINAFFCIIPNIRVGD